MTFRELVHRSLTAAGLHGVEAAIARKLRTRRLLKQHGVRVSRAGGKAYFDKGDRRLVLAEGVGRVYEGDIVRDFDFFWDGVYPEQVGGRQVVDYSAPRDHRVKPSGLVFKLGAFTEVEGTIESYFRRYRPKPGDVVFDGGANVGLTAYHFSNLVGEAGRVYSFEPDPANFACLEENVKRHGLTNVVPVRKALWSSTTTLTFNSEGAVGSAVADVVPRGPASPFATVRVEAVSIPDACAEFGVSHPQFVKLDVESAEADVVRGARRVLERHPVHFVVACHHLNGEPTTPAVVAAFEAAGYTCDVDRIQFLSEDALVYAGPAAPAAG